MVILRFSLNQNLVERGNPTTVSAYLLYVRGVCDLPTNAYCSSFFSLERSVLCTILVVLVLPAQLTDNSKNGADALDFVSVFIMFLVFHVVIK